MTGGIRSLRRRLPAALALLAVVLVTGAPALAGQGGPPAATPGTASGGPGSLAALLGRAPDVLAGKTRVQGQIASYADAAAQLATVGVPVPAGLQDRVAVALWLRAAFWLPLPDPLVNHALMPEWRQTFGFDVFQIDQSLAVGEPPNQVMLLRGRFNPDEVRAALGRSGYKTTSAAGTAVLSLHADAQIDLASQAGRLALAGMNNAVFLPDGTLVFTSTLDNLRTVIDVAAGRASSLARRVDVAALLSAMRPRLAAAFLVAGASLQEDPAAAVLTPNLRASPGAAATGIAARIAELGKMPPVQMALLGITPGGPLPVLGAGTPPPAPPAASAAPPARDEVALLMTAPGTAQQAVPVIERRLRTGRSQASGRPYADFFAAHAVSAAASSPVVRIELTVSSSARPGIVFQMLFGRDLGFIAW